MPDKNYVKGGYGIFVEIQHLSPRPVRLWWNRQERLWSAHKACASSYKTSAAAQSITTQLHNKGLKLPPNAELKRFGSCQLELEG